MHTAIYKSFDDINNFKIRIKIKEIRSAMYVNDETSSNSLGNEKESLEISWQQKFFSKYELTRFSDLANCETDLEKKYNKIITEKTYSSHQLIFTYTNEDEYYPHNQFSDKTSTLKQRLSSLNLTKSEGKHVEPEIKMFIMADFQMDEADEDTTLKTYILCTIKWLPKTRNLIIKPDFSTGKSSPYIIDVDSDSLYIFHYWIENCSKDVNDLVKFREYELWRSLNKRKRLIQKQQIQELDFEIPSSHEIKTHLLIEISTAEDFDSNNVFVQYFIDLPTNWNVKDENEEFLSGVTHCATIRTTKNFKMVANIGYCAELVLSYNLQKLDSQQAILESPIIYFEVVSKDSWNRYRTEGYTYKIIPINNSGVHHFKLQCLRVTDNTISSKLKDFFIGGCSVLDDVTWLAASKEAGYVNKYGVQTQSSGILNITIQIIQHSKSFLNRSEESSKSNIDLLNATSIVKSVNEVLRAFKEARHNMNVARQKIN